MISVNHVLPQILCLKGRVITEELLLKEITGMVGSDLTKKQDYRWVMLPWKAKHFNHTPARSNSFKSHATRKLNKTQVLDRYLNISEHSRELLKD